jgi:uncharacterized repeat protein (TIGR01451 family)
VGQGNQPNQQPNKRPDSGGGGNAPAGNSANRENDRDKRENRQAEAATRATPRARRQPANKLSLYTRGVAVLALLVVGGVGVYKGRSMLAGKVATPETADAAKSGDAGKPADPTVAKAADTTKPGDVAKPSAALAGIDKAHLSTPAGSGTSTASATDKKPGVSKFKFGEKAGGQLSDTSKPEKPKPSFGKLKGNSLPKNELPAAASAALADTSDYGSPSENPAVATPDSQYGAYGASSPAPVASNNVSDDYGSPSTPSMPAYGSGDAAASVAASPPASYGSGGYDAAPAAGVSQPAPSTAPPAQPGRLSALNKFGQNKPKPTTPGSAASPAVGDATPYGSADRSLAGGNPTAGSSPAVATRPSPPPNRLSANPLDAPLSSSPAATSGRYAQETPITPIGGTFATYPTPTPGAAASNTIEPSMVGPQQPTIAVEKYAPPEVQVGRPATFEIMVKNVGKVPAYDVTVTDEVPRGCRYRQASPQPTQSQTGGLVWKLGAMKPGEEKIIELQLVPETEGEIGSVAQVSFQAKAGAQSIVTRPKIAITHEAPQQAHAGDAVTVRLTITNSGTGAASNLIMLSDVPDGLLHEAGHNLETQVNPLRPGESTQVNLVMKAVKAGQFEQAFVIESDGQVVAEDTARFTIVAPGLQVALTGPKKRYVERPATHTLTIANPGTAAAKDVDVVAYLPRGFKFVSTAPAEAGGQYIPNQHAIVWGIEELAAGASAAVQLTTIPVEAGDQKLRVEARSKNGLTADYEQLVEVDAVSELPFTIHDLADPIEIGSDTAYEIRVSNRGAKDATNVVISVAFPPDLKPLAGDGAAKAAVSGQRIDFAPIGRLAPGSEAVVRVTAQGLRAGDHRIAVSLISDEQQTPITREESTRVYADQ